jgi:hypothetical protein
VLSNKHKITALEWDLPGNKLVVADTAGNVQLWMFKDHVLNDWALIGSTYFPGEHILGTAWFHNGKKVIGNEYYYLSRTCKKFPSFVSSFCMI